MEKARCINGVLMEYELYSGQKMNKDKSCVYFFNTIHHLQQAITSILGIKKGNLSSKFLGVQIFEGMCKAKHWGEVVERCKNKAMTWGKNGLRWQED